MFYKVQSKKFSKEFQQKNCQTEKAIETFLEYIFLAFLPGLPGSKTSLQDISYSQKIHTFPLPTFACSLSDLQQCLFLIISESPFVSFAICSSASIMFKTVSLWWTTILPPTLHEKFVCFHFSYSGGGKCQNIGISYDSQINFM